MGVCVGWRRQGAAPDTKLVFSLDIGQLPVGFLFVGRRTVGRAVGEARCTLSFSRACAHPLFFVFCLHLFTFCPQCVGAECNTGEGFTLFAFTFFAHVVFTFLFIASGCLLVGYLLFGVKGKKVKASLVTCLLSVF